MPTSRHELRTPTLLLLSAVGLWAACGAMPGPAGATAPEPGEPTTTAAEIEHAAANSPAQLTEAELRPLVDRMCQCGDGRCADSTMDEIISTYKKPIADADRARVFRVFRHALRCYARHRPHVVFGILVGIVEETADAVCACEDAECAIAAAHRGMELRAQYPHVHDDSPEHTRQEAEYLAAERRASACCARLPGAADPAAANRAFVQFAQNVCSCRGNANCIASAEAAHLAAPPDRAQLLFADSEKLNVSLQRARVCGWQPSE